RGDGPVRLSAMPVASRAPPHARGWTASAEALARAYRGSPARAGMDPFRSAAALRPPRLPRTRGDGPAAAAPFVQAGVAPPHARGWTRPGTRWPCSELGSPARAGMDPALTARAALHYGLPRTRG